MMVVSVYDRSAESFGQPMFFRNQETVVRAIKDFLMDKRGDSQVHNHPADFLVYEVGSWNDDTGALCGLIAPRLIVEVAALAKEIAREGKGESEHV